ncbi:TonB family protein [Reinekea marina]|uniref:Energy transducer TonB n=1 Tax=Reinekea marina TaxID=1310421 RepID=A0ABV7WST9_9GAMM|nr:TonB family protein [Reinekea marina]MBU2863456.1 TonB family protein [Reinekea forsetii]MDN3650661.1 TonB family protein [Reinekea marina]
MATQTAKIGAIDRLSFTVFLAIALHALLIFGVSFSSFTQKQSSPTLDVTLSVHKSNEEVSLDEADFLADNDQVGSGTLDDKQLLKSDQEADIEENQIFQTTPTIQHLAYTELSVSHDRIITTSKLSDFAANSSSSDDGSADSANAEQENIILNNITDVATLKALLDDSRQNYAKRPRTKTLTAVSAKRAADAAYIHNWLQKVERIGNQNYPEAARERRLIGSVGLAVEINEDGSLRSVSVTRPSGSSILDQAAKQIVHLSAPFEPLSAEVLEDNNVLVIMRTWHFRVDGQTRFSADG